MRECNSIDDLRVAVAGETGIRWTRAEARDAWAYLGSLQAERDRLRSALEKIANFTWQDDDGRTHQSAWSIIARDALEKQPVSEEASP